MDAVEPSPSGNGDGFPETLAAFEQSLAGLRDSAQLARLTDDPAAPALEALVRLFAVSARQFQVRDRERKEIAMSMEVRARRIAEDATAQIQASGTAIIERLAPELSRLVDRSLRQRLWSVRLKILAATAGMAVALSIACFGIGYGMAYKAGRNDGLLDARTIAAAMATGPQAAASWAQLMADNDPVQAMKACRRQVSAGGDGRRYCAMPVWLDPPSVPNGAHK